jgi:hypothetical protein
LTNFQLLALALIPLTVAIWLSVKRTSAATAPALLAVIMFLLALGGPVWEWSKDAGGAGVPAAVNAAAFGESKAVPAFLWASIGAGLSALLVRPVPPQAVPTRTLRPSRNMSVAVAVVSVVSFLMLVVGMGASFFRNEVYLHADGPLFLLHAAWPWGIISGAIGLVLIVWEEDRWLRLFLIATAALWFIGPVCIGSRTACALPIMGSGLIIYNEIRRRRLHLPLIAAALILLAMTFFTFSVVNKAREIPHGLLNIPNVVQATTSDMIDSTDSILLPVKELVASVYAAFPDAEESVRYDVDPAIIANANPLPGTARSTDVERYWPYWWIPLSFAGEWYAAMGWAGQILLFGAIGWISGLIMHNLQRSRFRLISFLPLGLVAIISVFSIEYSSRMVWRMVSISLIVLVASYFVRERRRHVVRYIARETRNEQPWNATGDLDSATGVLNTPKVTTRVAMTIGQRYG